MAGHSKWANIRHRKGAQDAIRGKIFTKLIREITVSAKISPDPSSNPRLRAAIDKALSNNMTRDTIDRAIKRGAGGGEGTEMEAIRYEGYGINGVAVLVECLTDNRNRTVSDVRHAFTKHGGNLGTDGSVAYLFTKQGQIVFENVDLDLIMEAALEAGAEDIITEEENIVEVRTSVETFEQVRDYLIEKKFKPERAEITMIPATYVDLNLEQAQKMISMIDKLEDLDDVQEVYTNAEFPETLMEGCD